MKNYNGQIKKARKFMAWVKNRGANCPLEIYNGDRAGWIKLLKVGGITAVAGALSRE